GSIGVYAGAGMNTYLINNILPNRDQLSSKHSLDVYNLDSLDGFQMMITNDKDYISTRISYCLDLKGPSVNVQTACSTSLVAIHMASQSILSGESDMALAGGVSVKVPQKSGYSHAEGMIVAADGHCKAFDEKADGTIFGSGCGFVLLKSLSKALEDGDHIHAVIKGTSFNNDGGQKIGFAAPSEYGESSAIAEAIAVAGISADTIGYVETHGTGTELGDPIEVSSLTSAFRETTDKKGFCPIGSVKSNVGHLQIASGIVGFIKTALSVEHAQVPASLHFNTPNPKIPFATSPFYVNTKLSPWGLPSPRRAGVNSLGIGGANTHAILEEAQCHVANHNRQTSKETLALLTLSAKNEQALRASVANYIAYLQQTDNDYRDVCYTANVGRVHFDLRIALWGNSKADLIEQLKAIDVTSKIANRQKVKRPAFVFSGQGSQYPQMAESLYLNDVAFRQDFDQCDALCQSYLQQSLSQPSLSQLLLSAGQETLSDTLITQPMLFALEVCLAKYWLRLGLAPQYLMGHSLGEYAAACVAGVFSLEDGLKLVLMRARLMNALPSGGGMLAVEASGAKVREFVNIDDVSIAAINSPDSLVLSGELDLLHDIATQLKAQNIRCKQLDVSHAFHSKLLTPMLGEFADVLDEIEFNVPKLELVSNVTGKAEVAAFTDPQYWLAHLMDTVQFDHSVECLKAEGVDALVEIGPQATLLGMTAHTASKMMLLPSLRKNIDSQQQILTTLGALYEAGLTIDFATFHANHVRNRVLVPTYAFQKSSHWIDAPKPGQSVAPVVDDSPEAKKVLGRRVDSPVLKSSLYEMNFSTDSLPYLIQHEVFDAVVVPGAGHIAMLLEVCKDQFGAGSYTLNDLVFPQVMIVAKGQPKTAQLSLLKSRAGAVRGADFELISDITDADYKLHCSGSLNKAAGTQPDKVDLAALREQIPNAINKDDFYAGFDRRQIALGPLFRWVNELSGDETQSLAKMKVPHSFDSKQQWQIHPGLMDSCIQILMGSIELAFDETLIPFGIERIESYLPQGGINVGEDIYSHFIKTGVSADGMITGNVSVFNGTGESLLKVTGFKVRKISQDLLAKQIREQQNIAFYQFETRSAKPTVTKKATVGQHQFKRVLTMGDCEIVTNTLYGHESNTMINVDAIDADDLLFDALIYVCSHDDVMIDEIAKVRAVLQQLLSAERFSVNAEVLLISQTDGPLGAMLNAVARVVQLENPNLKIQTIHNPSLADMSSLLLADRLPGNDIVWDGEQVTWSVLAPLDAHSETVFNANGAFVITGAFGGLGLKTAEVLVEQGVKELILLSRNLPNSTMLEQIHQWQTQGVIVQTLKVDVADSAVLAASLSPSLHKINGIFHCAGVLHDQLLSESDWQSFELVYQSKVKGTQVLHELSQKMPQLRYFVCYSSVSSVFGALSQAAYGSANAFMDALMDQRKQAGLPALSINWGPWADIGMASSLTESEQLYWHNQGLRFLDADAAKKSLVSLLKTDDLPAQVVLADVNWDQLAESVDNTVFAELLTLFKNGAESVANIIEQIEAADISDRFDLLTTYVQQQLASVLGLKEHQSIDGSAGLMELGLDSLAAVGLKGRLEGGLKVALKATLVFDYPTLDGLIEFIGNEVLPFEFNQVVDEEQDEALDDDFEDDEDIADALERELAAMIAGE
ncbi:MAG: SDR family NAD(P)-dependent oxidoreductase, partial [Algicola sp.]|nr:SDR family NAD(P)-dependent oxidoreductase [Algicola sp.]